MPLRRPTRLAAIAVGVAITIVACSTSREEGGESSRESADSRSGPAERLPFAGLAPSAGAGSQDADPATESSSPAPVRWIDPADLDEGPTRPHGELPAPMAGADGEPARADDAPVFVDERRVSDWLDTERFVLVDVRSAEAYARGHLPGAVHLPWTRWWEPPIEGSSESGPFRTESGSLDARRYASSLGDAGIEASDRVCVYGDGGGAAEALVAAMVLDLLGHARVHVMAGDAVERWVALGNRLSTESTVRPAARYEPAPRNEALWNLDRVLANVSIRDVRFLDVRSRAEHRGELVDGHRFGGRIPGAEHFPTEGLLGEGGSGLSTERASEALGGGAFGGAHRVVYGRHAADAALGYLTLRELGFEKVSVYANGWQEYGNRSDTPIDDRSVPPMHQ